MAGQRCTGKQMTRDEASKLPWGRRTTQRHPRGGWVGRRLSGKTVPLEGTCLSRRSGLSTSKPSDFGLIPLAPSRSVRFLLQNATNSTQSSR